MKRLVLSSFILFTGAPAVNAQKVPEAGYVFPAGGKAGTTIDVHLGGYDWTPDMEYLVHDKRVRLDVKEPPGPILVPGPPYWFGAKGRLVNPPLPREVPAKLTIPADIPPGPIYWQAANANGCTSAGVFIVGDGLEIVEQEERKGPQLLPILPITVSGRLLKNEEVDRYRFTASKDGPITCELFARRIGAKYLAILEVRDPTGRVVADAVGTNGVDPVLTFLGKKGTEYVVHIHDIDFGGDRSYVYRLTITPGPRIVGTIPARGRRGETREVELVLDTGGAKLESVKRQVTFPAEPARDKFDYQLQTDRGATPPFLFLLSDVPETVAAGSAAITGPAAVTAVLDLADAEHRYTCKWKKGEVWAITADAKRIGSPLDVALTILGPDGKQLGRNDDLPGTTDAGLDFTVPADGTYQIVVNDMVGKSGSRAAIYRLSVQRPASDFGLQAGAQRVGVPLGGKFDLSVKAMRKGGFQGPITLSVQGLPAGVTVPPNLVMPAGKSDLIIPLQAAKDASAAADLVTITGTATISSKPVTRSVLTPTTRNLAPRCPDETRIAVLAVASTMKPRFKGRPVDQDTGRKVHRGSTFPAEVIVERLDGFQGDIILQMAAQQSYQVQGISGGDVKVPPNVKLAIYPCYMPEWLETTRTSRLGMIAIAQAPDPKGRVRWLANEITGFVTVTLEGALLKVSATDRDLVVPPGQPFDVRLKVSRLSKLAEPARLELRLPKELAGRLKAEPVLVPVGREHAVVHVVSTRDLEGVQTFAIRATALQDGRYPAISETEVTVEFSRSKKGLP